MTIDPISLGISIALTAASMAITASQHYEGPRVADLKATSADYGTPLINFKGRRVFSCSVPWAEDLVDHERNSKSKAGKMTSHYATGTCMVHIADHPIDSVRKIWADEHLIYDRDGATQTFQFGEDYNLAEHLRFYTGTPTQEPDPRMLASVEAVHGPGTCPAYRYQSYFIVEDAPLDLIGNRYPQWRVEAEAGLYQADIIEGLAGGYEIGGTGYPTGYCNVMNSPNGEHSVLSPGLFGGSRFVTFDNDRGGYNAAEYIIADTISGETYAGFPVIDNAGNTYVPNEARTKTFKVAPGGAVTQIGSTGDIPGTPGVQFGIFGLFDVGGTETLFYSQHTGTPNGKVYSRPTSGGAPTAHDSMTDVGVLLKHRFTVQDSSDNVWLVSPNDVGSPLTEVYFWCVGGPRVGDFELVTGLPTIQSAEHGNFIWPTFFDGKIYLGWNTVGDYRYLVAVDEATFTVSASVDYAALIGTEDVYLGPGAVCIDTLREHVVVVDYAGGGDQRMHRIKLDTFALETATVDKWPALVHYDAWSEMPPSTASDEVRYPEFSFWHDPVGGVVALPYDSRFIDTPFPLPDYHAWPPDFALLFTDDVRLRDIFTDLSLKGGLEPSEYDYSDLDQQVLGFSWTQGTAKQIAAYLLDVYDSDIVPHDFKIVGKKRGSSSLGSILTPEFVAGVGQDGGDRYTLPYTNDRDLPRNIYFNFSDFDADQNPNTASPSPRLIDATASTREMSVDAQALAMTATEAKRSVDRYHRRKWFSRVTPAFSLTRQRLAIEPGDVYTPDFDGESMICRAEKTVIGANGVIKTEWALDDPVLTVTSSAEGAPADGHVPSEIFDPANTEAAVLDVPLLTDAHDQAAPFAYLATGPGEDKPWPGAVFSQSDTGASGSFVFAWDSISSSGGAVFGETDDVLEDALPWEWDNGPALTVVLGSGSLTSTTEEAVLNDGTVNLCAVESADGWELIQFVTATLVAPLTYEITKRLRGVRGTEQHIAGHDAGDRFILLSAVKVHTLGASEIGDTDSYIASTSGQSPTESDAFDVAFAGNAHRPYAAVNGTITDVGSDKEIDAVRRTRIGGSSLNGMDVPLGEASEAWQADIFDGATFKRTLTGTSLPLTYLAADIATDAVSSLVVKLYQMNPTLNLRGFPLTITP